MSLPIVHIISHIYVFVNYYQIGKRRLHEKGGVVKRLLWVHMFTLKRFRRSFTIPSTSESMQVASLISASFLSCALPLSPII